MLATSPSSLSVRIHRRIAEIPARDWDALAGAHPGLAHAFLEALESSGAVGANSGWAACHLALWQDTSLVAAMPLYEKQHSYGEYVFDWAWADAYARHGLAYYPKLLGAIPFSPLPGARLLGRDAALRRELLTQALRLVQERGHSSLHILFAQEEEAEWMAAAGMLLRHGVQFHWHNSGYRDFEAFLAVLNHDKRKKIRQDRKRLAASAQLSYHWLEGAEIGEQDWEHFFQCYALTYALHRSQPYLNRDFFFRLVERAPQSLRLLQARSTQALGASQGGPVASALFLADSQALYGRYWGATQAIPCLHFELCYYQPIEYCIAQGLSRMEGGAQGEHKLARGLEPVATRSAHWLAEPAFRDAVDRYLQRERGAIGAYLGELEERRPYARTASAAVNDAGHEGDHGEVSVKS